MRQLAENPELRAQLARQAKDVCRAKYSFAAFSRAANTLYDAVEKGITSLRNACN
jgi:hypothetical protein